MTDFGWWSYIYRQIPLLIRRSPANHTVPRCQMGFPFLLFPNKSKRDKGKPIKPALRPSLVHSAEPIPSRAVQSRSYLLSHCPDMDWMVTAVAAFALWRLALLPPPSGTCSPNWHVALDNWGTWPQHERTYVRPLALKHPPRGICASPCDARLSQRATSVSGALC